MGVLRCESREHCRCHFLLAHGSQLTTCNSMLFRPRLSPQASWQARLFFGHGQNMARRARVALAALVPSSVRLNARRYRATRWLMNGQLTNSVSLMTPMTRSAMQTNCQTVMPNRGHTALFALPSSHQRTDEPCVGQVAHPEGLGRLGDKKLREEACTVTGFLIVRRHRRRVILKHCRSKFSAKKDKKLIWGTLISANPR